VNSNIKVVNKTVEESHKEQIMDAELLIGTEVGRFRFSVRSFQGKMKPKQSSRPDFLPQRINVEITPDRFGG